MKIRRLFREGLREVVALWDACGLERPYNDPAHDIALVRATANATLFLGYDARPAGRHHHGRP